MEKRPVTPVDTGPPEIAREMRGMWIATVANIDWPSRAGLTADQQRAELTDIMNRAAATGLNAIVFHVRPAADAVYQSSIEPWGAMLTGTQGQDPGYDPLVFAIQEAHARGLELHAWINPFRAGNTSDTAKLASTHLFNTRRDLVRVYGSNIWLDPGEPDVQDRSMLVILDIVRRYDIDAIHADDYFYPYVENDAAGRPIPFPDSATYAKYGGALAKDDWRRANIDRFVERARIGRLRDDLCGFSKVAAAGMGRLSRAATLLVNLGATAELSGAARLVDSAKHAGPSRVAGSRRVPRQQRDVERVLAQRDSR
jgi:uncharacterized lipoprotein YddW (UPF0748 family)